MGNYKSTFWHTRSRRCCVHLYLVSRSCGGKRPTLQWWDPTTPQINMPTWMIWVIRLSIIMKIMVGWYHKIGVRASNLRVYTLTCFLSNLPFLIDTLALIISCIDKTTGTWHTVWFPSCSKSLPVQKNLSKTRALLFLLIWKFESQWEDNTNACKSKEISPFPLNYVSNFMMLSKYLLQIHSY